MNKLLTLCALLSGVALSQPKEIAKDSNGLYFNIKEHYGSTELDSGTALLFDDKFYYLTKKDKPTRILPMSRWTVDAEKKYVPEIDTAVIDGVDVNYNNIKSKIYN